MARLCEAVEPLQTGLTVSPVNGKRPTTMRSGPTVTVSKELHACRVPQTSGVNNRQTQREKRCQYAPLAFQWRLCRLPVSLVRRGGCKRLASNGIVKKKKKKTKRKETVLKKNEKREKLTMPAVLPGYYSRLIFLGIVKVGWIV